MRTITHLILAISMTTVLAAPLLAETSKQPNTESAPSTPVVSPTPTPAQTVSTPPAPVTGSLWGRSGQSIYTDTIAHRVGDLLTVIVAHDSTATTTATHSTSKGTGVNASAGSGLFDVFPGFGVKADQSTSGKGTSTASTRIVDRITVTVMEVLPNGNLRIQGARTIKMEKDEMKLIFSGVVRPNDISYDNSVSSLLVADQRLEEQSSGPIASKRRPGILSRLLDYLW